MTWGTKRNSVRRRRRRRAPLGAAVKTVVRSAKLVGAARMTEMGGTTSFNTRRRGHTARPSCTVLEAAVETMPGPAQLVEAARETAMETSGTTRQQKREDITIPELVKKLVVPPAKRTDVDCKLMAGALYTFVSSMEPWKDVCPGFVKTDALAMAKQAELQTVDANQTVFFQGEVGDEFYFVLQGSVKIKLNNKVIKVLGDKTTFGELAMQCKCKRSATVLGAEDDTRLLVIDKKLYHRLLAKPHQKDMRSKMKFIKKLNAGHLAPDAVARLCTCIKMQKVTKSQEICSFNEPAKFIYYLIEGSAEQHSCDNGQLLHHLLQVEDVCESLTVTKQKRKKFEKMLKQVVYTKLGKQSQSKMHRLTTLVEGQIFGEASWMCGQQAMTTVVARSDCKLWVLPFAHVNKIVQTQIKVREHLKKVARMKLQFRLERFNTLSRAASKCLQPAVKRQTSRTNAWTVSPKIKISAWTVTPKTKTSSSPLSNATTLSVARPKSEDSTKHTAGMRPKAHQQPQHTALLGTFLLAPRPNSEDSNRDTAGRRSQAYHQPPQTLSGEDSTKNTAGGRPQAYHQPPHTLSVAPQPKSEDSTKNTEGRRPQAYHQPPHALSLVTRPKEENSNRNTAEKQTDTSATLTPRMRRVSISRPGTAKKGKSNRNTVRRQTDTSVTTRMQRMPISRPVTAKKEKSNKNTVGRRTGTPRGRRMSISKPEAAVAVAAATPGFVKVPRHRQPLPINMLPLVSDTVRKKRRSQLKCRFSKKYNGTQRRARRPRRTYVLQEFHLGNPISRGRAGGPTSDSDGAMEAV